MPVMIVVYELYIDVSIQRMVPVILGTELQMKFPVVYDHDAIRIVPTYITGCIWVRIPLP